MNVNFQRRDFLKATIAGLGALGLAPELSRAEGLTASSLPRPTSPQIAWQEAELGLVFHYDLHLFDDVRYVQHKNRKIDFSDPNIFNPAQLNMDQWIEAAKACRARFAILTASHETGFRLWQSDANPYSLSAVQWGGGKRDLVREFVTACRSADIQPGIYLGTRWNGHLGVWDFKVTERSPLTQAQYNRLIEREVEEICSRYGDLFELWFDGGAYGPEEGGPDVLSIFEKYQPHCLFYHNFQRADARWGGTESGTVPYPCWATVPWNGYAQYSGKLDNFYEILKHGDPEGKVWCPAMSDAPLRNHEWFWEPNDEHKLYSLAALQNMYYQSVGHNSTLIIGATPDNRGLMPNADMKRLKEWGDWIGKQFDKPVAQTSGEGDSIELRLSQPTRIDHVILQEDIAAGERVRAYIVEGFRDGQWKRLCSGTCIGHKRIEKIDPTEVSRLRLRLTLSTARPLIAKLAAHAVPG